MYAISGAGMLVLLCFNGIRTLCKEGNIYVGLKRKMHIYINIVFDDQGVQGHFNLTSSWGMCKPENAHILGELNGF